MHQKGLGHLATGGQLAEELDRRSACPGQM
jgi:hypothetical protein